MTPKNGFLLFITSCLSGCGQMYQGYMKRGLSLLGLGCLVIALTSILSLGEVALLLPVLWLYAFFDTYNLRARMDAGIFPEDSFLFGLDEMDSRQMERLLRARHSVIGWVLVALGVYALWQTLVGRMLRSLLQALDLWWLYDLLFYGLPRLIVIVAIIWLGVWFIRGPKKRDGEDYTFVPPQESADSGADKESGEEMPR